MVRIALFDFLITLHPHTAVQVVTEDFRLIPHVQSANSQRASRHHDMGNSMEPMVKVNYFPQLQFYLLLCEVIVALLLKVLRKNQQAAPLHT